MKVSLLPALMVMIGVSAASCGNDQPAPPAVELEAVDGPSTAAQSLPEPSPIDGWPDAQPRAPFVLPGTFSIIGHDGEAVTAASLRGEWTIMAFWGLWSEDSLSDIRYMQALRSAVGQDPDLSFVAIHTPPTRNGDVQLGDPYGAYLSLDQGLADQGASFVSGEDPTGVAAAALNVTSVPSYLLIGPDLTIEARRGAIALDETDGIKSMIRGVAQIRSEIAAP